MPKTNMVVVSHNLAHQALSNLRSQKDIEVLKISSKDDFAQMDLAEVTGMIIGCQTRIDSSVLARAKKLQVIISPTSGFDHIDLEACAKWGISVMHTPEAQSDSVAQLTWTLTLALANRLLEANKAFRSGVVDSDHLMGQELAGKTFGLIGLGRVGSRVASIASAFGMHVIAYDPYLDDTAFQEARAERLSYEELLMKADVMSFHVPATTETKSMLHRSHFEFINRQMLVINTSCGGIIDEDALVYAVENNLIAGCALDTFKREPMSRNSKLMGFRNVVLTPGIGANTQQAFEKASDEAVQKLLRFYRDGSTRDTLPPKAPWYEAKGAFALHSLD